MYSLGSESGDLPAAPRDANRMAALGAKYAAGPVLVSLAHQALRVPDVSPGGTAFTGTTGSRKENMAGPRYRVGGLSLYGGYFQVDHPGVSDSGRNAWTGADWKTGSHSILAQVQKVRIGAPAAMPARATVLGLGYIHSLSNRTALYASYGRVDNNAQGAPLAGSDVAIAPSARGADVSGLAVGIRHNF